MTKKSTTINSIAIAATMIGALYVTSCDTGNKHDVEIRSETIVPVEKTAPAPVITKAAPTAEKRRNYIPLAVELPAPLWEGTPKNVKSDNLERPGSRTDQPTTWHSSRSVIIKQAEDAQETKEKKTVKYVPLAVELPAPIFGGTPKDLSNAKNLEAPGSRADQPVK